MYWVMHLLFNGVWRWNMYWDLDNLLNGVMDSLYNGIRGRNSNLDRDMNVFFDRHMYVLFDWVWQRDLLDNGQCLFLVNWEMWDFMVLVKAIAACPSMKATFLLLLVIKLGLSSSLFGLFYFRISDWFLFVFGERGKHQR
jgi:hypothetical protein